MNCNDYKEIRKLWDSQGFDSEWVRKNSKVIQLSQDSGLAVAGSFAVGLATGYPRKIPGDLDFVARSVADALSYVQKLQEFLLADGRSVHFTVQFNSHNKFVAPNATTHIRVISPFWMPICIMVIGEIKGFYWKGIYIQNYGYVKRSAQALEDISPKGRMEAFDEEFDEDMVEADREDRVAPKLNARILEDEELEDIHDIEISSNRKISGS